MDLHAGSAGYFTHADVDYQEVAELIARQLLSGVPYGAAVETLEDETQRALNREERSFESGTAEYTHWQVPYAAAKVLRDTDRRFPEDPAQRVLVSPRLRENVLERIVHTVNGRVVAEFLHATGWRRHEHIDLRTVMRGEAIPWRVALAMSREAGSLDDLPTEEVLAFIRKLDPAAHVGPFVRYDAAPNHEPELSNPEIIRLTTAELRDLSRADEQGHSAADASNAAIAAAILELVPAFMNSVTLHAMHSPLPSDHGFTMRVYGESPREALEVRGGKLRLLVARRYEIHEHERCGFFQMWFRLTRVERPEWRCEVSYHY